MFKSYRQLTLAAAFVTAGLFVTPAQAIALASFTTTSTLPKCDDCSVQVPIGFSVEFGASTFSSTWVNNNGNISFERSLAEFYTLENVQTGLSVIAPFLSDVDTRGALGTVSVGSGTYNGAQAFAVTWDGVQGYEASDGRGGIGGGPYSTAPYQNSFQLILTNRADTGAGNFDIYFNYASIEWSATYFCNLCYGTEGLRSADRSVVYNVPSSGTSIQLGGAVPAGQIGAVEPRMLINTTNNGVPGQIYLRIRDGAISTVSPVPEPATWALMLGGCALIVGVARRRRGVAMPCV